MKADLRTMGFRGTRTTLSILLGALCLGMVGWTQIALSQTDGSYSQSLGRGEINWTGQYLEVVGSGVAPKGGSVGQQRLMAQRAAIADAYRNLLELVQGVQVDSETTVRDFVTESDLIRTRVQGVVKGARPAGPARTTADGVTEITLRMPLFGKLASAVGLDEVVQKQQAAAHMGAYRRLPMLASSSLEGFSWSSFQLARCERFGPAPGPEASPEAPVNSDTVSTEPSPQPEVSAQPIPDFSPTPVPTAVPIETGPSLQAPESDKAFTGLIIDARGLGLSPSMSPMVSSMAEQVYVGNFELDIDRVINEGIVLYFSSLEKARANRRAGAHPLVVKAVGSDRHKVDFVLNAEDARQIAEFDRRDHFLKNLNVVAVL